MKIFRDLDNLPTSYQGAVVTLGNFDGLHLGHRAIIKQAQNIAKNHNAPLALMTFEPHPREFFTKEILNEGMRIQTLRDKLLTIKELGIEQLFLLRFNQKLANMSAKDFVEKILNKHIATKHIITGENFYFGKNRTGDKNLLANEAARLGFGYTACPAVLDNTRTIISSSNIRTMLKNGDVKNAAKLLGKPYSITGRVKHGEKRGRKLGFPTANLTLDKLSLPKLGVYAVKAYIPSHQNLPTHKEKEFWGVANIGTKPTFGQYNPLLEVHLLDTNNDLYGKQLCVQFIDFIREEKKFSEIEELKKALQDDCKKAKELCDLYTRSQD